MTAWLACAARRHPRAPALIQGADRLDYAELAEKASGRAAMLADLGLRPGDRVMLEAPVTLESALWLHALLWLGATVIPIGPSLPQGDAEALLKALKPRAFIGTRSMPASRPAGRSSERGLVVIDAARGIEPDLPPLAATVHDPGRPATIMHTSGSSSRPKSVPLTLGNHAASAAAVAERVGRDAADRWLLCLPLEHIGGLSIVFRSVILGHAAVLMPRFDAAGLIELMNDREVTLMSLVPSMLDAILKLDDSRPAATLRAVFIGGASAPPALLERARRAGWPVLPTWGMTEACSQLATPSPATAAGMDFDTPALPPLPGVEVRTARSGALQVRGPMLFSGYLDGDRDDEQGPDAEGWFTTGDRGTVDSEDRVQVLGRIDNVIISGGINVHLAAVEQRLVDCPLIAEAAVVGMDDPHWGQRIAAAVVVEKNERRGSDPIGTLESWSRLNLVPAERPASWRIVDRIPRSGTGKPLAPALRALFE